MQEPFISVVIPTHNSRNFIVSALNSVYRQSYRNFEVVVSDDGSVDDTAEVAESLFSNHADIKARLVKNQHKGAGFARNQGVLNSSADWIAFLDSDDLWYQDKLEKTAAAIRANPKIDLWCHSELMKTCNGNMPLEHYKHFDKDIDPFISLYRKNSLSPSAVVVRKDTLLRAGLFDESLPSAQDYELWMRLAKIAKIDFIKDVLGEYLLRDDNITSHHQRRLACLIRIADKHREYLKKKTRLYFIEELKFRGRAYISTASGLISQRKMLEAAPLFIIGILYWPFRRDLLRKIFKR